MSASPGPLEAALRNRRSSGGKALVPYLTGGLGDWQGALAAAADAGADAMEVGIPFSDPVMDGPVIQEANDRALAAGVTPLGVLDALGRLDIGIPLAVMTYYNIAFRFGLERFASVLAEQGVAAAILPDLPLEEAGPWTEAADAAGVETVLLAAPTASDERLGRICARARGFVYGVGLLGVTGVRDELAASAVVMAKRPQADDRCARAGGRGGRHPGAGPRGVPGGRRRRGGLCGGAPHAGRWGVRWRWAS